MILAPAAVAKNTRSAVCSEGVPHSQFRRVRLARRADLTEEVFMTVDSTMTVPVDEPRELSGQDLMSLIVTQEDRLQ